MLELQEEINNVGGESRDFTETRDFTEESPRQHRKRDMNDDLDPVSIFRLYGTLPIKILFYKLYYH